MKKTVTIIILALVFLLFTKAADYPTFIEKWYSTSTYSFISQCFRHLLGWIPFSIGDILYITLGLWIMYNLLFWIKNIKSFSTKHLYSVFIFFSIIYFSFYILWGFNYSRIPISTKLNITHQYSKENLLLFTENLIQKTNQIHLLITHDSLKKVTLPYTHEQLFKNTIDGYTELAIQFPYLKFEEPSIKTSIISLPLSYMGFSGYLNPFTNEAQVNSKLPLYNLPTTSCHEMAHQIGIGSESEANLIGYLASIKNNNNYFKYSGYTYALRYCLSEVHNYDKTTFKKLSSKINPGIWKNFDETKKFHLKHQSPIETVSKLIYGNYLKMNQQKEGMKTYNNFVGLIINYYQRYDQSQKLF